MIGSGKGVLLKDIAKIICKKFNKEYEFKDNKKRTFLVADNKKLKKLYNFSLIKKINKLIF